jgi:hypothetical protein
MSKETQEERFQELIKKAEALGYTLEYDKQLDPNKRSSLWNYRYIAHLKINEDISIQLDVIGDVSVYINEDKFKDKSNSGRVGEELSAHYKSDSELYDAINSGVVELIDNNWYEICGYHKGQFVDLMLVAEDDDYLLAIEEMIDRSAEILEYIKEEIEE